MIMLRPYQHEAINSIFRYYVDGGDGNIVLALPTGTGKSLVLAEFIRQVMHFWPSQRIIALTHVKELIEQNAAQMRKVWPHAPLGIYSAGMGARDTLNPIIYGGVASVIKCVEKFGHRDLLLIDECHLLSPDGNTMYQKIIQQLRALNPNMKVIGLTATNFRLGQGRLTQGEDSLFNDCPFNICNVDGFHRLIIEGYISPPIPKRTRTELDVSGVSINKGEYVQSELQHAVDTQSVNFAALTELCEQGQDRKAWLIFCSGIEHADHCAEMLQSFGVECAAVHSKITPEQRDERIKAFKAGELRALTNNNVLTTGFDHPPIDLIGMLRPTVSPGLWVQMLGRGTRPSPGKQNCLVLDFAGNTKRLGPIDDPAIPKPKGEGSGDVPVKICDSCGCYNHTRVRFCVSCGAEFEFKQKIVRTADTSQLLTGGMPQVESFDINRVYYNRHIGKKSGKASIKIMYQCGLQRFTDFVTFDIDGFPRHKANDWWRTRFTLEPPLTTDQALTRINEARVPRRVKVWTNCGQYPRVMGVEF